MADYSAAADQQFSEQIDTTATMAAFAPAQQLSEPLLPTMTTTNNSNNLRQRRRRDSRLLDRDASFHQSRGRWQVQARGASRLNALTNVKQFWGNWFYTLAYQRTIVLMLILFSTYTAVVFFYAAIYRFVSSIGQKTGDADSSGSSTQCFCDMDIHDHMEALYFSLSTMTTIGYGVSDYYFGGCWTPLLLVLAQVCTAITFDAVAIGLIFQRISRGHKRGKTVLFSNTAVVRRVRGRLFLQFRIAELRRQQLLEASVRAYCVRQERQLMVGTVSVVNQNEKNGENPQPPSLAPSIQTTHFVTKPLKLQHEDVSSHILMSLPQVMVHVIDERSPLYPPKVWYDADGQTHHHPPVSSPDEPTEKDTTDALSAVPENDPSHREKESMELFARDRQIEIIVLVEGTDELTGAVIQTRHSYTYSDLAWNQSFVPCVFPYTEGDDTDDDETVGTAAGRRLNLFGRHDANQNRRSASMKTCLIDYTTFHETTDAPENADDCPYVTDCS